MPHKIKLLVLLLLTGAAQGLRAQENSPYTRYGFGDLKLAENSAITGMGSVTAAYDDGLHLNFSNPASYAHLKLTTFDFSLYGSALKLKSGDLNSSSGNSSLHYFALGFPIKRNVLGGAFGLLPYSSIGYSVNQDNIGVNGVDSSNTRYLGSGRIYQAFVGSGFAHHNLSAGLNLKYMFGTENYAITWELPPSQNAFNTYKQESRYLNSFLLEGGLQYQIHIKDPKDSTKTKYELLFGVNGNLKTPLHATHSVLYERFLYASSGLNAIDSVQVSGGTGKIIMPMQWSGGFIFRSPGHYSVGFNVQMANWSQYQAFGESDSTQNSMRVSLGGEWVPAGSSNENYLNLIRYRAGIYYGKSYLLFQQQGFTEKGFNLGLGLPLKRMNFENTKTVIAELNLSLDAGQRGTLNNGLLRETYYRVYMGITLSDLWFIKRKYD